MFGLERPPLYSSLLLTGAGAAEEPSFSGALDAYTTDLAGVWSVRRRMLASYTGPLIRVRRSSDSTEQDIGYDANGDLDTAALLTFCGAGDGFVRYIYDQSGGTADLSQGTAAAQRRIVNAGVLDTCGTLPTALCTANDAQFYVANLSASVTSASVSVFYRGKQSSVPGSRPFSTAKNAGNDYDEAGAFTIEHDGSITLRTTRNLSSLAQINPTAGTDLLYSIIFTGSSCAATDGSLSDSAASSGAFDFNRVLVGAYNDTVPFKGLGQSITDLVLWQTDQTANEAAIRAALLA